MFVRQVTQDRTVKWTVMIVNKHLARMVVSNSVKQFLGFPPKKKTYGLISLSI